MKFEIQPDENGYILVTQAEPQTGGLRIHVSEVENLANELKKAVLRSHKQNPNDASQTPPSS